MENKCPNKKEVSMFPAKIATFLQYKYNEINAWSLVFIIWLYMYNRAVEVQIYFTSTFKNEMTTLFHKSIS